MKINNTFPGFLIAIFVLSFLGACASKKGMTTDSVSTNYIENKSSKVDDAIKLYTDWNTARINGKLHLSSLPVSPTLKIYMKKGKELTISASAILVGEVFRAELTEDSLFIVNKMKKTYCKESGEKLQEIYPTLCEEVQSILLGRMIVPGSGTLSASNVSKVDVETVNDMRKVMPRLGDFPIDINAYYLIDKLGRVTNLKIEADAGKPLFSLIYDWKGNGGTDIEATVTKKDRPIKVEIDLDAPKWGGEPLSPFKLGKDFKRVGLKEFFKSI